MDTDKGDWFTNVENLRPIRGGRRGDTLNAVASDSHSTSSEQAEAKFKELWKEAESSKDPLDVMCCYASWFDEHFPSGRPSLYYPIVYKICSQFGTDVRYQEDERLLKFWITLSEIYPDRGHDVFELAFSRGSCRSMAKLYVHWSQMLDRKGWSNRARDILDRGLMQRATPVSVIHAEKDRLEMRIMRDTLAKKSQSESDYELTDMDEDDDDFMIRSERKTLGRLTGVGPKSEAPIYRIANQAGGHLGGLPQSHLNASFDVFEDEPVVNRPPSPIQPLSTGRIADEFLDDPEFQPPKANVHLHFDENLPLKSDHGGIVQSEIPLGEEEFEVYSEDAQSSEPNGSGDAPHQSKNRTEKFQRMKFCVKKEFAVDMSIEEGYALMIEQKNLIDCC